MILFPVTVDPVYLANSEWLVIMKLEPDAWSELTRVAFLRHRLWRHFD